MFELDVARSIAFVSTDRKMSNAAQRWMARIPDSTPD